MEHQTTTIPSTSGHYLTTCTCHWRSDGWAHPSRADAAGDRHVASQTTTTIPHTLRLAA